MPFDNTNTGVLFKHTKDNDKQPDYKGKVNIAGKELEVAGWIRVSKAGKNFLSLKFQEPRPKAEAKPQPPKVEVPLDDDVPF